MGGRSGGWDHRDQDSFIKVWTQLGCSPSMIYSDGIANSNREVDSSREDHRNEYKSNINEYKRDDSEDEAEKESHDVDASRHDHEEESLPPSYDNSSCRRPQSDSNDCRGSGIMTLPTKQFSSLLRRLPVAVPGKLQEELEEHITW